MESLAPTRYGSLDSLHEVHTSPSPSHQTRGIPGDISDDGQYNYFIIIYLALLFFDKLILTSIVIIKNNNNIIIFIVIVVYTCPQ